MEGGEGQVQYHQAGKESGAGPPHDVGDPPQCWRDFRSFFISVRQFPHLLLSVPQSSLGLCVRERGSPLGLTSELPFSPL